MSCSASFLLRFVSAVELRAGGSLTFKIWESGQHQAVALPPRSSMDVRLQGTSARFLTNHAHTLSQQNFAAPKVAPKEQNESVDLPDELRSVLPKPNKNMCCRFGCIRYRRTRTLCRPVTDRMARKHRLFSPLLGPLYTKVCSFTKTRDKHG